MQAFGGAVKAGKIERKHLDADRSEDFAQLPNPFGIGAIAASDRQRLGVEPHRVAAFDRSGRFDTSKHRNAKTAIRLLAESNLAKAKRLARSEQQRPGISHDRWIEGEH